jgi:hypothetical protein
VQIVVDNKDIYPLLNDQPVIIEVHDNNTKIVISDGFHFTKSIELNYSQPGFYHFRIVSPVNDLQLLGGAFVMIFFYLMGFLTGLLFIKLISFIPILLLICIYYLNRRSFIQLRQEKLSVTGGGQSH